MCIRDSACACRTSSLGDLDARCRHCNPPHKVCHALCVQKDAPTATSLCVWALQEPGKLAAARPEETPCSTPTPQ
eukprot:12742151-Prorocentrum_lima.AAC.1